MSFSVHHGSGRFLQALLVQFVAVTGYLFIYFLLGKQYTAN